MNKRIILVSIILIILIIMIISIIKIKNNKNNNNLNEIKNKIGENKIEVCDDNSYKVYDENGDLRGVARSDEELEFYERFPEYNSDMAPSDANDFYLENYEERINRNQNLIFER